MNYYQHPPDSQTQRRDVIQRYVWEIRKYVRDNPNDDIIFKYFRTDTSGGFIATTRHSNEGIGTVRVRRYIRGRNLLKLEAKIGLARLAQERVEAAIEDIHTKLREQYDS